MKQTIHIACSTDDNYSALCGVMLCSLMENNKNNNIHIHILANGLSIENKKKFKTQSERRGVECSFNYVNEQLLANCQYRTNTHRLSKAAYYRILLASTLLDVEKVIYLDCDMIVLKDLSSIYNMNINGIGVGAIRDYDMPKNLDHYKQLGLGECDNYFNSGFMLINLKYWREHDCETQLVTFANMPRKVYFHDQDALNYVFKHNWLRIEPKWNRYNIFNINVDNLFSNKQEMLDFFFDPCVIHYPGRHFKPWFRTWFIPYKKEWIHYKDLSEWDDFGTKKNERTVYTIAKLFVTECRHFIYRLKYWRTTNAYRNKWLRR